jgi:IS30 family transposase
LLEDGVSVKEAGQKLNIHRSTVYEEFKRFAQALEGDGLKNYL